jgi:predicted NBD/HSP70 family sugar kinase
MKVQPLVAAPLDPEFQPLSLFNRNYLAAARAAGRVVPLVIGLERESCLFSRFETVVRAVTDADTLQYVERLVKFLLWSRGGWRLHVGGPAAIGDFIRDLYSPDGARKFDVALMSRIYEKPFEVVVTEAAAVPPEQIVHVNLGRHNDGCRLGFDLGASDFKVAAVQDGRVVYSDEFPWQPAEQPDPEYHYQHLSDGLKKAASYLPRVDAIGGSSAGVIVNNQIMVASLFRAVPPEDLDRAKNIFLRLRDDWNVPLEVANDGDVTALAGALSLSARGLLGIAMGSSEAAGYLNPRGGMTGWLSELAFAPVDINPKAAVDEWSGDGGVGVMYFSQQAVNRLLTPAGIRLPMDMNLPSRLRAVQEFMVRRDPRAIRVYETLGVYFGYAIALYADFYEFDGLLMLGRVATGRGGSLILARASDVLRAEFPALADKIQLHVPDELSKRVGQAVAAAGLPPLKKKHESVPPTRL